MPGPAPAVRGSISTKAELLQFNAVFPDVVRDLTETGRHLEVPAATKWFAKVSLPAGLANMGRQMIKYTWLNIIPRTREAVNHKIIKDFKAFTEVQLRMMKTFPAKDYHFLLLILLLSLHPGK